MMTLSLAIVQGFQSEIKKKVIGFGSHLQITNYQSVGQIESDPILMDKDFYPSLTELEGINHIQVVAYKGAILKNDQQNLGVVVKGISQDFNWEFFESYLKEGEILQINPDEKSNELLISQTTADKLALNLGDDVLLYFLQEPPRVRKLRIKGIYSTGLGEMDEQLILTDIRHIQKVNDWDEDQIGAFEVFIDDFDRLDNLDETVYQKIGYDLVSTSIKEVRPDIFNWLELQDLNVIIIISLLILVCGIDIVSALLILILERTTLIGVLKSLGSRDSSIQKIFLYNASYLIVLGLFYGNILGLGFALLQRHYGFLTLPQEAYFIDVVPIELDFLNLFLLNLGTLALCFLMLLIPSKLVAKIDPVKSIRFD